jgi:hypothetical protein
MSLRMDDDSFERDLFRARARSLPRPVLNVDAVIARGELRRRARVVSWIPFGRVLPAMKRVARGAGAVAMLHAAAGVFVWMGAAASGTSFTRAHVDITPDHAGAVMSVDEPEGDRGVCGAAASFFGVACESTPATMTMRERASCDAPAWSQSGSFLDDVASLGSGSGAMCASARSDGCGDFVTCVSDRP